MKKWFLLFIAMLVLAACHRSTCPAYMDGAATGMEGGNDKKKQELFSPEMKKKKN